MAELAEKKEELSEEFFILGVTSDGRQFRPSDWVERLCGVMAQFNPDANTSRNARLQFSPYVRPAVLRGIKSVEVSTKLRALEPLAFHFVLSFAKDNDLKIVDANFVDYPEEKKR